MSQKPRLLATVDRIERDEEGHGRAVLLFDDGQQLVVAEELLPTAAAPQQVVQVELRLDAAETSRRAGEIQQMQRDLFGA